MINYNDKIFKSVTNTSNGQVSSETIFHYHQADDIVWATYEGGQIRLGNLIAKVDKNGCLNMRYHHICTSGELMTGVCSSTPQMLENGKIRMHEEWAWTSGDCSKGSSIIEEI